MSPHGTRAMAYMASSLAVGLWAHPAERCESREPPFLGLDRVDGSSGPLEATRTALRGLAFIVVWGTQRPGPAWASQDEGPGMPKGSEGALRRRQVPLVFHTLNLAAGGRRAL